MSNINSGIIKEDYEEEPSMSKALLKFQKKCMNLSLVRINIISCNNLVSRYKAICLALDERDSEMPNIDKLYHFFRLLQTPALLVTLVAIQFCWVLFFIFLAYL